MSSPAGLCIFTLLVCFLVVEQPLKNQVLLFHIFKLAKQAKLRYKKG